MKLWVCESCGESYDGQKPPAGCPKCGKLRFREAAKEEV